MSVVAGDAYLTQLLRSADQQSLATEMAWQRLLHVQPGEEGPQGESLADDSQFFLADTGKQHPILELQATLTAFFAAPAQADDHAQCRFPARLQWLTQVLKIDRQRLPAPQCKELDDWLTELAPRSLTLVFPSAYLNNPSSMFGHTLLRVDTAKRGGDGQLLAYAINYAADYTDDGNLLYVIKGLSGGYPGYFGVFPYYEKVKEYNDLESRDIWEYQLKLTPAEVNTLLLHVWELQKIRFDYYFFDENCSYQLLSLLEVVRPELEMTVHFPLYAIPTDTVRAVRKAGLIGDQHYRPSNSTELAYRAAQLSAEQRELAEAIANQTLAADASVVRTLSDSIRVGVLELAYDVMHYRFLSDALPRGEYAAAMRAVLLERSQIKQPSPFTPVPRPRYSPDEGHDTARYALATGRADGQDYVGIQFRPSYHDLLDSEVGYANGAQIRFFDTRVRFYSERDEVRLEEVVVMDILSLSPRSRFFSPISWKFNTGLDYLMPPVKGADEPRYYFNGGAGLSYREGSALFYGFVDTTLEYAQPYEQGYALGLGLEAGMAWSPLPEWKLHLQAASTEFTEGDGHRSQRLVVEQRFTLGPSQNLVLSWQGHRVGGMQWRQAELSWQHYF